MNGKKLILIAEDEPLVQKNLAENLSAKGFETVGYSSAEEMLNSALVDTASLVIMDIQLPGMNGLEATAELKKRFPSLPVIMLTAYSGVNHRVEGFATGADDYLIKPFFMEELIARIHAVQKRYEMVPSITHLHTIADLIIDKRSKSVSRSSQPIKLSQTEFNLLVYLAEEEGHPVTKEQIFQRVWNGRYNVSENTIEVYINLLRNKVDKPFEKKLIHTKPGFGYYLSS
jgi:two-component system copper resistance phosphate regulon response regulator CusR